MVTMETGYKGQFGEFSVILTYKSLLLTWLLNYIIIIMRFIKIAIID